MWFTETPWPPIILMLAVSLGLFISFLNTKRGFYLIGCMLLLAGSVGVYFVEQRIVTEAEVVEQSVIDIAAAFEQADKQKTLSFFSDFADKERAVINSQFDKIKIKKGLRITDMHVTLENENTAVAQFRANGTVLIKGISGSEGHYPTRWRIRWKKEETNWKITKVTRLSVLKEKELDYLHYEN